MCKLKRNAFWAPVFLLLSALIITSGDSFAQGGATKKIRVGVASFSISFLPLRIAQAKGFFREEGLDVELVRISTPVSLIALMNNEIDYATSTGSLLVSSVKGLPLKVVMYFLRTPLHDLIAKPEFRSMQDLKGRVVAVSEIGATPEVVLRAMLGHAKMNSKDVRVLQISASNSRFESLILGRIDAAILPPPYSVHAEIKGFKRLMSVAEVPEVTEGKVAIPPPAGLGVNNEKLQSNPQQIKQMIRAVLKSQDFIHTQKVETTQIISDWLKVDGSVANGSYDSYRLSMSPNGLVSDLVIESNIDELRRNFKIPEKTPVMKAADFSIAKEALTELGKKQ
jgi:NitT/TauT family transport system substrate-binding protein